MPPPRQSALLLRAIALIGLLSVAPLVMAADDEANTYDQDSIIRDATEFFGKSTEGLAKVVEKAFADNGQPTGYIKGQEVSAAITVGLRYGDGELLLKNNAKKRVYWQGQSVGFDLGANASKVFILVYNTNDPNDIFQRFPAIDGSLYYVGGAGISYMHYTRNKTLNPL